MNSRAAHALTGFGDTSKSAFQDGLHLKIISFAGMHEWALANVCVCDLAYVGRTLCGPLGSLLTAQKLHPDL